MLDDIITDRRSVLKSMAAAGLLPAGVCNAAARFPYTKYTEKSRLQDVVPAPVETKATPTEYTITSDSTISIRSTEAREVAEYLADILRPSTGYRLPVVDGPAKGPAGGISLWLTGASSELGDEGYRLNVTPHGVKIRANKLAGLFNGIQTLRQLLPVSIESNSEQSGPWTVPGGHIRDYPRFEYRSAMLDVAREFYPVEAVKRYIDEISLYKINYLHLHLTDDSGWRIMIDSWTRLATYGGQTDRDGGQGGYYTQAEYKEIVDYAQARNITIVPEIDMPGHTAAALASYDKLACEGEEWDIGEAYHRSSLCIDKEVTYEFVDDVIREISAMTPGPYIHVGGDEALGTSDEEYAYFFDRVIPIVQKYGKRAIGWHQILTRADSPDSTVGQYWGTDHQAPEVETAAQQGNELIVSPASRSYIDMKYNENTPPDLGLTWAGYNSVKNSYTWDPGSYINGVGESSVLGPEASLWGETLETMDDIELLTFPRLPAIAELGWSPWSTHNWQKFKYRLAAQGPRWDVLDINYYRSPQVPWPPLTIQSPDLYVSGEPFEITATFVNTSLIPENDDLASTAVNNVNLNVIELPDGWTTTTDTATKFEAVPDGESVTAIWEVVPTSTANLDEAKITVGVTYESGSESHQLSETTTVGKTWRFHRGDNLSWKNPSYETSDWTHISLPYNWDNHGYTEDRVYGWFRTWVTIPEVWKNIEGIEGVRLPVGKPDDVDTTYFNGKKVGHTGRYPYEEGGPESAWSVQRNYSVPKDLINFGEENLIAIRIWDLGGAGGIPQGQIGPIAPIVPEFTTPDESNNG